MNVRPSRGGERLARARAPRSGRRRAARRRRRAARQLVTLISAANLGITTVTGMPSRLAVIGDALRVIAGRRRDHAALARASGEQLSSALRAPRSLKLPVRCR